MTAFGKRTTILLASLTVLVILLPSIAGAQAWWFGKNKVQYKDFNWHVLKTPHFDIHFNDPMGGMRVTPKGFAGMTRCLLNIADECCDGKLVMTLEGGYDLIALKESIREVMMELIGIQVTDTKEMLHAADPEKIVVVLGKVKKMHQRFWKSLSKIVVDRREMPSPTIWQRQRELFSRIIEFFKS